MGQALNLLGLLVALGATLLSTTVTSVGGVVPMVVLAILLAMGFAIRLGGATWAASKGRRGMPWTPRVLSWACFGVAAALLGLAGSVFTVAAFGAFVVLDAMGGLVKRDEALPPPRAKRPMRHVWITLGVVAYLGAVVAFHLVLGRTFTHGVLVSWSLLSLGFCVFALLALRGPKASEAHLGAPVWHRRHERREEAVADPQRKRAEDVLLAFQARGDAGPFLDLVRQAALAADLRPEDVRALEVRIHASFARAGTDREADVRAALDEVERFLSLRKPSMEIRR